MVGKIAEKDLQAKSCGGVTLGKLESRIPHPATRVWKRNCGGTTLESYHPASRNAQVEALLWKDNCRGQCCEYLIKYY